MFRAIAPFIVSAAVLAAPLRDALACQCASNGPAYNVEAAKNSSSLIFEARVDEQGPQDGFSGASRVKLADLKAHRGAAPGTALTLTNGDDCPPKQLESGQRYLFYLRDASSLHINACYRVVAFPGAQEEIAALGGPSRSPSEPSHPAPEAPAAPTASGVPSAPPQSGGCAACSAGSTESRTSSHGLWLLALTAAVAVRTRAGLAFRQRSM